ncbi:MAG: hypothetical protein EU539_12050, partial [Promethearchaeota archaeon]
MNKKNLIRDLTCILSVLMIVAILIGNHAETGNATNGSREIPEEDENNNWQWDSTVQVNDKLIYELTYARVNVSGSGEGDFVVKDNFILNITSIDHKLIEWGYQNEYRNVSQVNATQLYYNCIDEQYYSYGDKNWTLISFQYNATEDIHVSKLDERLPIPFVLPINSTLNGDMDALAQSLNYSSYYPFSFMGIMNLWDYIEIDMNTIRYTNNSGYVAEFTFLDNGTLDSCLMYFRQWQDTSNFNVTIRLNRIYDPSVLSETAFTPQKGDTYYTGRNMIEPDEHLFGEFKADIVEVKPVMNNTMGFRLYGGEESDRWTCFKHVIANISQWKPNLGIYELIEDGENITIAMANNHYPFFIGGEEEEGPNSPPFIPIDTPEEDLEYMVAFMMFQGDFPFDLALINEENNVWNITLIDSTENELVGLYYNKTTGEQILQIYYGDYGNEYDISYRKDRYIITDPMTAPVNSYFGLYLDWEVDISIDPGPTIDIESYSALLPVSPINSSVINFFEIYGHGYFDSSLNNELDKYQVYLELYSNLTAPSIDISTNITFKYSDNLVSDLSARDYNERDLRPYYLYNDSSGPSDFDYEWLPLSNKYFDVDEANNEIIINLQEIDTDMPYVYFTIGISTSADIDVSVEVGDVLYYGGFDENSEYKGEVNEFTVYVRDIHLHRYIMNMTELYQENSLIFMGPGP